MGREDHTSRVGKGVGENLKGAGSHEAARTNTRWRGEIDEVSEECWGMDATLLAAGLRRAAAGLYERKDNQIAGTS